MREGSLEDWENMLCLIARRLERFQRHHYEKKLARQKIITRQRELGTASSALQHQLELRKERLARHGRLSRNLKTAIDQGRHRKITKLENGEKVDDSDRERWSGEVSSEVDENLIEDEDEEIRMMREQLGADTESDEKKGTATKRRRDEFMSTVDMEVVSRDVTEPLKEKLEQQTYNLMRQVKSKQPSGG